MLCTAAINTSNTTRTQTGAGRTPLQWSGFEDPRRQFLAELRMHMTAAVGRQLIADRSSVKSIRAFIDQRAAKVSDQFDPPLRLYTMQAGQRTAVPCGLAGRNPAVKLRGLTIR